MYLASECFPSHRTKANNPLFDQQKPTQRAFWKLIADILYSYHNSYKMFSLACKRKRGEIKSRNKINVSLHLLAIVHEGHQRNMTSFVNKTFVTRWQSLLRPFGLSEINLIDYSKLNQVIFQDLILSETNTLWLNTKWYTSFDCRKRNRNNEQNTGHFVILNITGINHTCWWVKESLLLW